MSVDLFVSFRSPFSDFKRHQRIATATVLLCSFAYAIALVALPGASGYNNMLDICWVRQPTVSCSDVTHRVLYNTAHRVQ